MVNLLINNQPVQVPQGTTIMEAARMNSITIPSLCYIKDVHKTGACRVCVVEVEGSSNLQASCLVPVREGMVVRTNTERVRKTRKILYELMLSDHSQDCLHCMRNQHCEFQALGRLLGVESSRFEGSRSAFHVDASASITRDMSKCILCRRCVTVCDHIQQTHVLFPQNRGFNTEVSPPHNLPVGTVSCTFCGQCTQVCPVGALKATSHIQNVWDALSDPSKRVAVQVAPAVRMALGEGFDLPPGTRVTGKTAAALRRLGFDDVFDTNFAADLTIMEEGTELLERLVAFTSGEDSVLPMITSCSPGWTKFIEHHYPDRLAHLSTCKSPHTMLGALIKSHYAETQGYDPASMYVVSVMPCTAKKYEIKRDEMKNNGLANVDAVLTTRELIEMIQMSGIDFTTLPESSFDDPLGLSTGAADIFGLTGGVMEAALRTVYELVTGRELPFEDLHVTPIVGLDQVKEATVAFENVLPQYAFLEGVQARVAVTSGLAGARKLMDQIAAGASPYHFIEVMGCPGGCIMGGGQPRSFDEGIQQKRLEALYLEDEGKILRKSHENPSVQALYNDFLGHPGGHLSHELLHTHYVPRGLFNELTDEDFAEEVDPYTRRRLLAAIAQNKTISQSLHTPRREQNEPVSVLELEAENRRLKGELQDSLETVDIMKSVLSKYVK